MTDAPAVIINLPSPDQFTSDEIGFTQNGTGAVTRLVQDKLRETISLKDFGAVADWNGTTGTDIIPALNAVRDYFISLNINDDGFNRGGPSVYIPAGAYYQASTFDPKGVAFHLFGDGMGQSGGGRGTLIWTATNVTAVRIQRYNTTGTTATPVTATRGSDGMRIEGIDWQSLGGSTGHGAHLRARASFTRCKFINFPQNGAFVDASAGGSPEGNANGFEFSYCNFEGNGLNGFQASGSDANAGMIFGCDSSYNARFGYKDDSFLGNFFVGNHAAANGVKGFAGNTLGSSIVSYGGLLYYVMPGQAAAAATTTPGTDAAIWGASVQGAGAPSANHPLWVSGLAVFEGGPYAATNANSRAYLGGNYAEGAQAPCQIAAKVLAIGCFWDEVGVVGLGGQTPLNVTNFFGALANPGGFRSDQGTIQSSLGVGGYHSNFVATTTPSGHQWQASGNDLRFTYSGSDTNEMIRVTGPSTGWTFGRAATQPHFLHFPRAVIGTDITAVRYEDWGTAAPTTGYHARGERVKNNTPTVGSPKAWMCTVAGTPGTWVSEGNL